MNSLRELQLEYNKRRMKMLSAEFGSKGPMTMRWSQQDPWPREEETIEKRLRDAYSDAYLRWNDYYSGISGSGVGLQQRFGTSPVRDAYWGWDGKIAYKKRTAHYVINPSEFNNFVVGDNVNIFEFGAGKIINTTVTPPEILEHYDRMMLEKPVPTMIFRRFGSLHAPEELDLYTRSFLGLLQETGYKFAQGHKICNDAWVVNLRQKDNRMDAFLAGFSHKETKMVGIDIGEELKDLFKVYSDAEAHLGRKEKQALDNLVNYMKSFIEVHEEKKKVSHKLASLKKKLEMGNKCEDCGDDDEDDGDDDE